MLVSVARLTEWRDRALAGAATALKERERNERDDEIARLKSKVGEITMDNELLNVPGDDAVHARSRRQPRFAPLASFLERVPDQCPHALFRASARASQAASAFIADNKRIAIPKENTATRMAALVLPTTGDNHARHAQKQQAPDSAAATDKPTHPCPCCGGPTNIIETFKRGEVELGERSS